MTLYKTHIRYGVSELEKGVGERKTGRKALTSVAVGWNSLQTKRIEFVTGRDLVFSHKEVRIQRHNPGPPFIPTRFYTSSIPVPGVLVQFLPVMVSGLVGA